MQGKKQYHEKLFTSFHLSQRIPENNFYRQLKGCLNLDYLYNLTKSYYGSCGQKSLHPIVFFKLCLVGYLENLISDRKLIDHCSMRLDILYFIDYDIDEELPWHSTISRTRQLFPEEIFEEVFTDIFRMCVDKGMVSGHTQCIDSAPVKANASMDSLELKVPAEELDSYLRKFRYMSTPDRKAKNDNSDDDQRTISASDRELKEIESRNKNWQKNQDERLGAGNKGSKYTSNKTHYSPTDPDAKISVKPGKARKLNYLSQLSVDTAHHVISLIGAYHADKKDNQYVSDITEKLKLRLQSQGLLWRNFVADTGYSSGENYAYLESEGLVSYIPPHGTYKGGPEGFTYVEEGNYWICPENKHVTFRKVKVEKKNSIKKNVYFTTRRDCKGCPQRESCIGKSHERRIEITYYKDEYERAIARVKSKRGRYMKSKRQSTVEPVFGTLTQFMGMRKVNTKGIELANKVMLMSGAAYNLKKYLKFINKKAQAKANAILSSIYVSIMAVLALNKAENGTQISYPLILV